MGILKKNKTKFDVDDPKDYEYLDPIWRILENTGEKGITKKEIIEQTGLDPGKVEKMVMELTTIFARALSKALSNPFKILDMNPEQWYDDNLADSWLYDKFMLLGTRIDHGQPNPMDDNPLMDKWKERWLEKRGM